MRKVLAALIVLTAALFVAPAPTATSAGSAGSAGSDDADRAGAQTVRRGTAADLKRRVVALTNNRREARGCRAVVRNGALNEAAQTHTRKMAQRGAGGTLSHQLPGEPSPGTRIERAGYALGGWGENVAAGQTTARAVMRTWMNSRGHRANILNCGFRHIGVGLAYANTGTPYWTQVFAHH